MRRLAALMFCVGLPALAHGADISIQQPWMRYLLPTLPAAGYMVVTNHGPVDEILTGASSSACGMLMLHRSQDDSGVSTMSTVPAVTIPAGGDVGFTPGGYHLMCMQPHMKAGDRIKVTLAFQSGVRAAAEVPVYGAGSAP